MSREPTSFWFVPRQSPPRRKSGQGLNGIVDEGKEIMKEFKGSSALDAGLLTELAQATVNQEAQQAAE